jgi:hypothetical protein
MPGRCFIVDSIKTETASESHLRLKSVPQHTPLFALRGWRFAVVLTKHAFQVLLFRFFVNNETTSPHLDRKTLSHKITKYDIPVDDA